MMNFDSSRSWGLSESEKESASDAIPTEQEVVNAIRNTRRRYALYQIHKYDCSVALNDLVDQVAAWEACTTPEEMSFAKRKSVYAALHQIHLTYMEARGLIRWDRSINCVECGFRTTKLDLLLANDPRTTIRWYRVYVLLAGAGSVLLGLTWLDVSPFGAIPPFVITGCLLGLVLIASFLHWYDVYRWRRRMNGMPPDFLVAVSPDDSSQETEADTGDDDR